jgi:hypothetical protein
LDSAPDRIAKLLKNWDEGVSLENLTQRHLK